jgi:hypothetical protein
VVLPTWRGPSSATAGEKASSSCTKDAIDRSNILAIVEFDCCICKVNDAAYWTSRKVALVLHTEIFGVKMLQMPLIHVEIAA